MRKDAPFSARKRWYGRGLVTRSIRSGGITVAALASAAVVVLEVNLEPFLEVAGGRSTSRTIVWSSLPSISRNDVDLLLVGIGHHDDDDTRTENIVGEGYACDDDVARAACAIAVITSIDVIFMVNHNNEV